MLVVVFAKRCPADAASSGWQPVGRLAWPWYVPLGTLLAVGTGIAAELSSATAAAQTDLNPIFLTSAR